MLQRTAKLRQRQSGDVDRESLVEPQVNRGDEAEHHTDSDDGDHRGDAQPRRHVGLHRFRRFGARGDVGRGSHDPPTLGGGPDLELRDLVLEQVGEPLARGLLTRRQVRAREQTLGRLGSSFSTWRAMVILCTSVGPSAMPITGIIDHMPMSGISFDVPSEPWMCSARYTMSCSTFGREHLHHGDLRDAPCGRRSGRSSTPRGARAGGTASSWM